MSDRSLHEIDDVLRRCGAGLIAPGLIGGACAAWAGTLDGYRVVTRQADGSLRERRVYSTPERLRREPPEAIAIEPLGDDARPPTGTVLASTWRSFWRCSSSSGRRR